MNSAWASPREAVVSSEGLVSGITSGGRSEGCPRKLTRIWASSHRKEDHCSPHLILSCAPPRYAGQRPIVTRPNTISNFSLFYPGAE